jgi:threonine synthase
MRYQSTRGGGEGLSFAEAALAGLAPDGGLYIPEEIPRYPAAVRSSLGRMDFQDIALESIGPYVGEDIPRPALEDLVQSAYPFGAPLVPVGDRLTLELFHGPTAAFKDFGARFMARAFSYLRRGEDRPLIILVATSGDTGGAVAAGFFGVEGIEVRILYPKGRVSPLQERQIAGLGGNVRALAVEGSFDDCQRLVKAAFTSGGLRERFALSSANSINVARLVPQTVYYAAAAAKALGGRWDEDGEATPRVPGGGLRGTGLSAAGPGGGLERGEILFCVPSGNFGNLCAGLYALSMGAPIRGFVAATNINRTVPDYLESGLYEPRPSRATISNAMDVGAPSNFERMAAHWSLGELRGMIRGVFVTDEETRETIAGARRDWGYFLDPHGAVGWRGLDKLAAGGGREALGAGPWAVLATAHPAKFAETVEPLAGPAPVPSALAAAWDLRGKAISIPAELSALIEILSAS